MNAFIKIACLSQGLNNVRALQLVHMYRCSFIVLVIYLLKKPGYFNVGRRQENQNVNKATVRDCNMLISPATRPEGHLQNKGRFLLRLLTTIPHTCEGETGTKSYSLWLKSLGTYGLKARNCQQAFHSTYSYLFRLHICPLPHSMSISKEMGTKE